MYRTERFEVSDEFFDCSGVSKDELDTLQQEFMWKRLLTLHQVFCQKFKNPMLEETFVTYSWCNRAKLLLTSAPVIVGIVVYLVLRSELDSWVKWVYIPSLLVTILLLIVDASMQFLDMRKNYPLATLHTRCKRTEVMAFAYVLALIFTFMFTYSGSNNHCFMRKRERICYRGNVSMFWGSIVLCSYLTERSTFIMSAVCWMLFSFCAGHLVDPPIWDSWSTFAAKFVGMIGFASAFTLLQLLRERTKRQFFIVEMSIRFSRKLANQQKTYVTNIVATMLPPQVLDRIGTDSHQIEKSDICPSASFLQFDVVDFTQWCSANSDVELATTMSELVTQFDAQCLHVGAEKVKTIGDAYQAVAGLLNEDWRGSNQTAIPLFHLSNMLHHVVTELSIGWTGRVGIATGPLLGTIVGKLPYRYDVFGGAADAAQELEPLAKPEHSLLCIESVAQVGQWDSQSFSFSAVEDNEGKTVGYSVHYSSDTLPRFRDAIKVGVAKDLASSRTDNPLRSKEASRFRRQSGGDGNRLEHQRKSQTTDLSVEIDVQPADTTSSERRNSTQVVVRVLPHVETAETHVDGEVLQFERRVGRVTALFCLIVSGIFYITSVASLAIEGAAEKSHFTLTMLITVCALLTIPAMIVMQRADDSSNFFSFCSFVYFIVTQVVFMVACALSQGAIVSNFGQYTAAFFALMEMYLLVGIPQTLRQLTCAVCLCFHLFLEVMFRGNIGRAVFIIACWITAMFVNQAVKKQTDVFYLQSREVAEMAKRARAETQALERVLLAIMPHHVVPQLLDRFKEHRSDPIVHRFQRGGVGFFRIEHISPSRSPRASALTAVRDIRRMLFVVEDIVSRSEHILVIKTVGNVLMVGCCLAPSEDSICDHLLELIRFPVHLRCALFEHIASLSDGHQHNVLEQTLVEGSDTLGEAFSATSKRRRSSAAVLLHGGIHFGPVTTTVMGINKLVFDVFGSTVNIASRLLNAGCCSTQEFRESSVIAVTKETIGSLALAEATKECSPPDAENVEMRLRWSPEFPIDAKGLGIIQVCIANIPDVITEGDGITELL